MPSDTKRVAVIGGGVAGLTSAYRLESGAAARGMPLEVVLFERETRTGGKLRSRRERGYLVEEGPNGWLDNEPATLDLVRALDLDPELQRSEDAARHRFLLMGGRLRELPLSPPAFLKSDILPLKDKLRVAAELIVPARRRNGDPLSADEDESIDAFGRRRLGAGFAASLLDPMVKGIFGGDSRRLSLAACFPRMVELESRYGGLIKAMIRLQRERRGQSSKSRVGAGPGGVLHSFHGGMNALTDTLAAALKGEIRPGAGADRLSRDEQGAWWVHANGEEQGPFDLVVDATPAHSAVRHHDGELAAALTRIPYAPMAVITLAFDRDAVDYALRGFGMLIPRAEGRRLLGVLWSDSIFTGRAPEEKLLLRCMAGGAEDPGILDLDDEELVKLALSELRELYGLRGAPERRWVIRHAEAIAQYEIGHLERLSAIDEILARRPGLYLTGSSYRGVSVNHCVAEAGRCAQKILSSLANVNREEAGHVDLASLS